MASEWRQSTWGDEISLEYGKGIRGYKYASGPYRVYGSNGAVGWTTESLAPGPGVILGRKGACRGVEFSREPFFVIDTAYYVKPKNELDMRWVYYAMKYHRLGEIDDGSPIPSTTRSAVYVRELRVPQLSVQQRIADVLGKLDDKIELNRRMNRTLERMAAAIFKSWFIDFDPVHAKADLPALSDRRAGGRQEAALPSATAEKWFVYALECEGGSVYIGHTEDLPRRFDQHMTGKGAEWTKAHPPLRVAHWEAFYTRKEAILREKKLKAGSGREWLKAEIERRDLAHSGLPALPAGQAGELADLFPDTFDESDIGAIPTGWKVGSLGDVADSPRRGVKPSDVPPTTPYIGLEHMPRRNIALDAWGRAEDVASGKSQFKRGEILFGKLRPYFHKVGIAPVDGVCSTDIVVVTPKAAHWHGYVIALVSSKAFVDYTDSHSAGTKMPRTNWKDMGRYPLALPPEPLAKAFQDHVAVLHERITLNIRQNRRLAGLRDTLLPKLLSGEIEVPEAEELAEEVGT